MRYWIVLLKMNFIIIEVLLGTSVLKLYQPETLVLTIHSSAISLTILVACIKLMQPFHLNLSVVWNKVYGLITCIPVDRCFILSLGILYCSGSLEDPS